MKNIKIFWDSYQNSDVKLFKSINNSWNNINISNTILTDYCIYIDNPHAPLDSICMLVEPNSIHPNQYEIVKSRSKDFKYILTYDKDYFKTCNNVIHISPPFGSWINGTDRQLYNKTKNISFIASTKRFCNEHNFRQDMVNKFSSVCDVYGTGRSTVLEKKINGLKDYRFSFCMENYITNLYYTEKVLDCFLTGTIPIYYGSKLIETIFDPNGIVWLDDILENRIKIEDLNEEFYKSRYNSVIKNYNIANNINNNVSNSIDGFILSINKGNI